MSERQSLHDRILESLKREPSGLTTIQLCEHLGRARGEVSALVSKMAAYGGIAKERAAKGVGGHGNRMLWKAKENA